MNKNLTENEIYELIRDASECDGEPELPAPSVSDEEIAVTLAPKKRMSVRAMLPLAACFLAFSVGCGLILSALRGAGAPLVPDGADVTEEYLEEEFPGLLLPSAEGYKTSSVYLYSDGDTPRYAALIYTAESAQLDYKVVFDPDFEHDFARDYTDDAQIGGLDVSYATGDGVSYAAFSSGGYEYYLTLSSDSPADILDIIAAVS